MVVKIRSEITEHTKIFTKKIYQIGENVYSAVGWGPANVIMIKGDEGVILVDTGREKESSAQIRMEFEKITSKPIKAVIYTHFHPDHIHGIKAFVNEQDVANGKVDIYAHQSLIQNLAGLSVLLAPIMSIRARYAFGAMLTPEEKSGMNIGIGPMMPVGTFTFIPPTKTISDRLKTTICGISMEIVHVPSEAPDELVVYLPETRMMLSAEVVQGPTFPNLYPLRGGPFRDPRQWVKSLDVLRSFKAEHMIPGHGLPVTGAGRVEEILCNYRDAIQYVFDQTIRGMNKGLTPEELAESIRLPNHLSDFHSHMQEFYGTVSQSARQIYNGYLGWFQGDPVALAPTRRRKKSERLVHLMKGRDNILTQARKALDEKEEQWAAELATYLLDIDSDDQDARDIKARAFRSLGYDQINITWRNWYLTAARELDGSLDLNRSAQLAGQQFAAPDVLAALPAAVLLEGMTSRLKAEVTLDLHLTLGVKFADSNESHAIEIRRGVVQFHPKIPEHTDVLLEMKRHFFNRQGFSLKAVKQGMRDGEVRVTGSMTDVATFFNAFDDENHAIWQTVR